MATVPKYESFEDAPEKHRLIAEYEVQGHDIATIAASVDLAESTVRAVTQNEAYQRYVDRLHAREMFYRRGQIRKCQEVMDRGLEWLTEIMEDPSVKVSMKLQALRLLATNLLPAYVATEMSPEAGLQKLAGSNQIIEDLRKRAVENEARAAAVPAEGVPLQEAS